MTTRRKALSMAWRHNDVVYHLEGVSLSALGEEPIADESVGKRMEYAKILVASYYSGDVDVDGLVYDLRLIFPGLWWMFSSTVNAYVD